MEARTHQIGGICSAVVISSLLFPSPLSLVSVSYAASMIVGSSIGSLLPDIDHPQSKIGRKAKLASTVVSTTFGHRGWTHTLLAFLIVSAGSLLIVNQIQTATALLYYLATGVSVGYLSHLILDALTVSGIPAFKPLTNKSFRLASLKTGQSDPGVQLILVALTVGVIYLKYFKH